MQHLGRAGGGSSYGTLPHGDKLLSSSGNEDNLLKSYCYLSEAALVVAFGRVHAVACVLFTEA